MPEPVGQPIESAPRIGLQHLAFAVEVGDIGDLVRIDAVLDVAMPEPERGRCDRAEVARKGDLLLVDQFLVAEHHDRITVDRILDGLPVGRAQRLCHIDAADLGDEVGMHWRNGDAHDRLPRL